MKCALVISRVAYQLELPATPHKLATADQRTWLITVPATRRNALEVNCIYITPSVSACRDGMPLANGKKAKKSLA